MNPGALLKPVLSQSEVDQYLSLKETQDALKKRLTLIEDALTAVETSIIEQIEGGIDTSRCGYLVSVKTVERRYPAWKEHFINHIGKAVADKILEQTEPKIYRNLLVKDAA